MSTAMNTGVVLGPCNTKDYCKHGDLQIGNHRSRETSLGVCVGGGGVRFLLSKIIRVL